MWYYIPMRRFQIQGHVQLSGAIGLFGILLILPFTVGGCAFSTFSDLNTFKEWQIIDTRKGAVVSFEELTFTLSKADVVYFGEEHYTPSHIQSAIRVLDALIKEEKHPVLAMEMFGWDGQIALDRYLHGELQSTKQFLKEVQWDRNWGGDYDDYQPLVDYARHHSLPLYALNPPRTLVRKVVAKGIVSTRHDADRIRWDFDQTISLNDPAYRRVLAEQLEQCHPGLSEKSYQRIYEASIFRDEGMAKVIIDAWKKHAPATGPVISYTGGGHIQYHVPIPSRVQRQAGIDMKQVSVYLMAFNPARREDILQAVQDHIANYIWLTPLGPRGPQPRCGE